MPDKETYGFFITVLGTSSAKLREGARKRIRWILFHRPGKNWERSQIKNPAASLSPSWENRVQNWEGWQIKKPMASLSPTKEKQDHIYERFAGCPWIIRCLTEVRITQKNIPPKKAFWKGCGEKLFHRKSFPCIKLHLYSSSQWCEQCINIAPHQTCVRKD